MINVESLRGMIAEELKAWDQPSISVGIVKDGKVELAEGFGYANMDKQVKPDPDTLYQIGSCSKAFTAAAVAILVDRGILEWDKPVVGYMPWLRFKEPFTTANVTVRDLLCHRTGLPRHDAYWIDGPCTRKEMVENLRNMQPGWSFRSHWCYQNTCLVAAGMLVEEMTGKTWEEFVKEEIFEPLGMTRSTFYVDAIEADANHATPYDRPTPVEMKGIREIPFLKSDREDMAKGIGAPYGPAGSIVSTVNDMLKWVQFNLNNGKVGDKQLISEAAMKEMHKANMLMSEPLLMPCKEMDFFSYGMGWFVETYRGHVMVEHGGNINGFSALVTLIPDQKLGVVTLTNFNDSFDTYATTYEIIDRVLGAKGGDWNNRWREFVGQVFAAQPERMKAMNPARIEGTKPTHGLADYAGTYRNATYGDIVIENKDGKLFFTYNKKTSELDHYHYDTFQINDVFALFNGMTLRFGIGNDGKIGEILFGIALNPAVGEECFKKVTE